MKKSKIFAISAAMSAVGTFICGIDSIFDNPMGLMIVSIFLGIVLGTIMTGIYALAMRIAPKKTQKLIDILTKDEDDSDELA